MPRLRVSGLGGVVFIEGRSGIYYSRFSIEIVGRLRVLGVAIGPESDTVISGGASVRVPAAPLSKMPGCTGGVVCFVGPDISGVGWFCCCVAVVTAAVVAASVT